MITGSRSGSCFLSQASTFILISVLTFMAPAHARAQAVYGSVSGIITDPSGAVTPGVTVTITSAERKTTDSVITNESGLYVKDRLVPGTYEVKAELSGFKTAVFPNVKVNVDTQTKLDVRPRCRSDERERHGVGLQSSAQDRPSRRRLHVRSQADQRPSPCSIAISRS